MLASRILWHERAGATPRYPELTTTLDVDVAIVGAGITGLTVAWQLRDSGLEVAVLEANTVGSGTTGSSTGNLYVTVAPGLCGIERKHGLHALQMVAAARSGAIGFIERICVDNRIDCGFRRVPFHLFALGGSGDTSRVDEENAAAGDIGLKPSNTVPEAFPFAVDALCSMDGQAQFDPLRYVSALAALVREKGCAIYERSRVLETTDGSPCTVRTAGGSVRARHLVKATHVPQGLYYVHAAMLPRREYALLARLQGRAPPEAIYWAVIGEQVYSLRPWRGEESDYVLLLGQPHEPGGQKPEHLQAMEQFLRQHFDVAAMEYFWCAQNYQSADHLPYIGLSPGESHTWIATGFAADGLVWGTVAGRLIGDTIMERENAYAPLFSPRRFTPLASLEGFMKESGAASKHLLQDHLSPPREEPLSGIAPGQGKVLKLDGERVAAYRDLSGQLAVHSAVCPHLGCLVHWNEFEKSWDCPCHGSRFATDGTLLEGPASTGLPPHRAKAPE